ncbi:MAG: TonB-dependent receptor [Lentimicrobiaceae bacterium]|nr:TonB-dependent receptor [Lentimicrobiaceae bacterium]
MRKIIFTLCIFTCFIYSVTAQQVTVYDKSDLQPIVNVSVYNQAKSAAEMTDAKGVAKLSAFKDNDTLFFKHIAYQEFKITKKALSQSKYKVYLADNIIRLDEVVLSANKFEEKKADIPHKIDIITAKQIAFNNPQTSADLLQQNGNIFVQQSQLGGGSPVLRGFEANKVLLVVDGVRMNNAIYRSGHLQSIITVDPNILQRVEVVFGPGSVIYGSDALGGVVHFYTPNPLLSFNGKPYVNSGFFTRYSSAANEMSGNVHFNIGLKKWAFLTNISYKNLDDLHMGSVRDPFYGDFGKCNYYVKRINGTDSLLKNSDPNLQKETGYSQYDIMQKILFQANRNTRYILNLQYSNSSNIQRYDRLQQFAGGLPKYAEWYYGPQSRLLASLRAELSGDRKLYDNWNTTIAYQNISEDRISRKYRKNNKQYQLETVDVFSLNTDLMKKVTPVNELRYGLETVYNSVSSEAYQKNILTGEKTYDMATRYPDDYNYMFTLAAYATHNWEISKKFIFSQGVRINYIALRSVYTDTMMKIMQFPFDNTIKQDNTAVNGNLGFVYLPGSNWRFALSAASGFRAPNVDDVGKVNDSNAKDHLLVIPNPDLKPEYSYNLDFTLGKTAFNTLNLEFTGFYTLLKDAIVSSSATFNGQDSVSYDGQMCGIQTNTNKGEAYIYGLQANAKLQLNPQLSVTSNLTYTYGRVKEGDQPLDHVPPFYGATTYHFELKKFHSEFSIKYNGWKKLKDYNPSGEDNLASATEKGMPAWYTLNLRAGYQITKQFNLQMALENMLDMHYRVFASGVSAPGRNFVITLRGNF